MTDFFKNPFVIRVKSVMEYVPLMLLTLMFISEAEMDRNITKSACNVIFVFFLLILLYICLVDFKMNRCVVVGIAMLLWIVLILIRKYLLELHWTRGLKLFYKQRVVK